MISGAGSGFGRLAAQRFGAEGARLSLADRDAGKLAETIASLDAEAVSSVVDVSSEQEQRDWATATVERFGGIDIALNNAGVIHSLQRLHELPAAEFDRMMAVNARGVFLGMKAQLPVMMAANGGSILNTASVAGLVGAGHFGAYVASKHAVVGLTRTAADEYARYGIRVNAICPAFAETSMLERVAGELKRDEAESLTETYGRLSGRVPMRRVGTTDEIVDAMLLISDPANTFMTGQAIAVDGGLSAI